jgi:hypothetical protein
MDELNPTFKFKISEQLCAAKFPASKYVHRNDREDRWCLRWPNHEDHDETEITLEELEKNLVLARREARVSADRLRMLEVLQYKFIISPALDAIDAGYDVCPSCGGLNGPIPPHGGFRCECREQ